MSPRLALALALALATLGVPAVAAAATPQPGCAGPAFADPAGDATDRTLPVDQPGQPNEDLLEGFFLTGGGVTSADLRVADLDASVPADASGLAWYVHFSDGGSDRYVGARTDGTTWTYVFGHVDAQDGSFVDEGTTTGRVFEGAGGVIEVDLPAQLSAPGTVLADPYGESRTYLGAALPVLGDVGLLGSVDVAPDDGAGASYAVAPCTQTATGV